MVTSKKGTNRNSHKKTLLMIGLVVLVVAASYTAYAFYHSNRKVATAPDAGPVTSTKNNAQHKAVSNSSFSQGGAVDQKGASTSGDTATDSSLWITSTSGNITLQQPTASSVLNTGDTIRGTAKTDTVQYRLVDDSAGVIAQGSLSVVGGKFSGVLQFKAYSSTGALKVFTIDPSSGAEVNHADIKIKLAM